MPFMAYETVKIGLGGGVFGVLGSVRAYRPEASAAADFYQPPLPLGLLKVDARSTAVVYDQQAYSVGGWSDNLVVDEDYRLLRQGIVPWTGIPTVVATGGPGPSGSCRCAMRFRDSFNNEVSPLSGFTPAFTLTNQQRAWSGLPTVGPEDETVATGSTAASATTTIVGSGTSFLREIQIGDDISLSSAAGTYAKVLAVASDTSLTVSVALGNGTSQKINVRRIPRWDQIDLMVEMDSGLPRVAATIPIGVTSYTEGTATLALGEAHVTDFERLPRGTAGTFYNERQWVIDYSDTAYASALFAPERHEAMRVRTKNGEPIIAIWPAGNNKLLFITPTNTYAAHGFTATDVAIELEDAEHGALNHWACANINGRIIVPNAKTISLYDGAYHNILKDSEAFWAKQYKLHPDEYEHAFAVHDPERHTYELYVTAEVYVAGNPSTTLLFDEIYDPEEVDPLTIGWVAEYSGIIPEAGGGFTQPDWTFDVMKRTVHSGALMFKPGARRGDVYFGFCDGFIRKRDDNETTDDLDSYGKRVTIVSRPEGGQDAGGDVQEGKEFARIWTFMETEGNTTRAMFIGGDENGWLAADPNNDTTGLGDDDVAFWGENVAATAQIGVTRPGSSLQYTYVPMTTHIHPVSRVSGRYVTGKWTARTPAVNWRWRGWGGIWGPGVAERPWIDAVNPS